MIQGSTSRLSLLRRLLPNQSRTSHRRFPTTTTRCYSRQQQRQQQPASSFWIAAVGSCVFFQLYDTHSATTTVAERQPSASPESTTNTATTTAANTATNRPNEKEGVDGQEQTPWYRRYPTQALESIRSPSLPGLHQFSSETEAHAQNNSRNQGGPPKDNTTLFYGQCLDRQLWRPSVPYPAWDYNWDGRMADHWSSLEALSTAEGLQNASKTGTTRHIILVRHGQYTEGPIDDRKRSLTALGRRQAQLTGKRMAQLVQHIGADKVNAIYTSDLLRAKQTAWIMAKSLPDSIPIQTPDEDLNEGLPAPMIPSRPDIPGAMEEIDAEQERMDRAFLKYFHRADLPPPLQQALQELKDATPQQIQEVAGPEIAISTSGTISMGIMQQPMTVASASGQQPAPKLPPLEALNLPPPNHEFDIVVCHGNVIRYFLCRALQIPPEAWLRLSVFNCSVSYIMIKPNGYVSCRMIGDIGHLGYKETSFSGAHGFLWS